MSPQLARSATFSTLAMAALVVSVWLGGAGGDAPRPATAQGSILSVLLRG